MKAAQTRSIFLQYFADLGHEVVPSSPLVPGNDPTLLFTNSGMVQFKDVFLGAEKRPYSRAATAQRCVRAGGKHNDLENVGYTARHHTFFEMLGNFSFGDYFKREAIHFAWNLLTRSLNLAEDRLWVTVYSEDDEAADVWLNEIGIPNDQFARIATSDNFWTMGDTGPCGPCSEIFYDHGPEVEGGPPGTADEDGDRYVELWNLVFMQYERFADGNLIPLPKPSVDTGMGLERISTVLQNVYSNYDIDLFRALIRDAASAVNCKNHDSKGLKVIADHIRSAAFLITDGVTPSNEGRGYVLRRIVRRAVRHGCQLGCREPFFHQLTDSLVEQMGDAYPELRNARQKVKRVLEKEEVRFARTLDQGLKILNREVASLRGDVLPGDVAFRLYDTYGFPLDLTADFLRELNLKVDLDGFEACMQEQRERAKQSSRFEVENTVAANIDLEVSFSGYQVLSEDSRVTAIIVDRERQDSVAEGEQATLILESTPFYAESGGQVGDRGTIVGMDSQFLVEDTQYVSTKVIGHRGRVVKGGFRVEDRVSSQVDATRRRATMNNHSATHLMHAALMNNLGSHVQQKGSLVAPDRLRFDFAHDSALTTEELEKIETEVNDAIRKNWPVVSEWMNLEEAKAKGAAALFGEKYESTVRVIRMGEYSFELCGGTHVDRTGDIGLFKILDESSIASGIRRIEALTGARAIEQMQSESSIVSDIARLLHIGADSLHDSVAQIMKINRDYERQIADLKTQLATAGDGRGTPDMKMIGDISLYVSRYDGIEVRDLRNILAALRQKLESGIIVLGSVHKGKATLICSVSDNLLDRLHAGRIIAEISPIVGGKGGGKAHLAQGGGADGSRLDAALDAVASVIA